MKDEVSSMKGGSERGPGAQRSGAPQRGPRVMDVAPRYRGVFEEVAGFHRSCMVEARGCLVRAGIPRANIVIEGNVISAYGPSLDGASGALGHLGACLGRAVLR